MRLVLSILGMAGLLGFLSGCGSRDLSSPLFPTGADSAAILKPGPQKTAKDTAHGPVTILIEALSATDLRMDVGQTKPAPVTVLPSLATSPLYEMTSSNPKVAEVTANGIHGAGAGSATITVHALDGSEKSTKFHVIVDAITKACLTLPCLCVVVATKQGDGGGKGKGGDKAQGTDCAE